MKPEEISELLPSISVAHLFFSFGKLEEMIGLGFDEPTDEFFSLFYEVIGATVDFLNCDYLDYYDVNKWYFSNKSMVEYYRLCRVYGSAHGLKLKDNPYMRQAQRFIENVMDFDYCEGYSWHLNTKMNHEWASGIVFCTDCYFNGEYRLLEALLEIGRWYEDGVKRLREVLEKEQTQKTPEYMEVRAA